MMPVFTNQQLIALGIYGVYIPIGLACLVLNIVCLTAIARSNVTKKSSAYVLVAVLAGADATTGVYFLELAILRFIADFNVAQFNQLECYLNLMPAAVALTLPSTTTFLLSAERLFIVAAPVTYHRRGKAAVQIAAALNILLSLLCVAGCANGLSGKSIPTCNLNNAYDWNGLQFLKTAMKFGPCVLCLLTYAALVYLYRQRNAHGSDKENETQRAAGQQRQNAITKTAVVICSVYFGFVAGGTIIGTFVDNAFKDQDAFVYATLLQVGGLCTALNSLSNPMLLLWRNKDIRRLVMDSLSHRRHFRIASELSGSSGTHHSAEQQGNSSGGLQSVSGNIRMSRNAGRQTAPA